MEIKIHKDFVFSNPSTYIAKPLQKYDMEGTKSVKAPIESLIDASSNDELFDETQSRKLLGSLQYLSNVSRPDIFFAVIYLVQFDSKPRSAYFEALKRILCSLMGKILTYLTQRIGTASTFIHLRTVIGQMIK